MSCQRGTFASNKTTWSNKSDLQEARWDPFPENHIKGCSASKIPGVTEQYSENGGCGTDCNAYNTKDQAYSGYKNIGPHSYQKVMSIEKYSACNTSGQYLHLDTTWVTQKSYDL